MLLSDIDGLYTADPRKDKNAKLIPEVFDINEDIKALAGKAGSSLGTGGMQTKINAALISTSNGVDMAIINGAYPEKLYDLLDGNAVGTRFYKKA